MSPVRLGKVDLPRKPSPERVVALLDAANSDVEGVSDLELTVVDDAGLRAFSLAVPFTVGGRGWVRFIPRDENVRIRLVRVGHYFDGQVLFSCHVVSFTYGQFVISVRTRILMQVRIDLVLKYLLV